MLTNHSHVLENRHRQTNKRIYILVTIQYTVIPYIKELHSVQTAHHCECLYILRFKQNIIPSTEAAQSLHRPQERCERSPQH